MTILRLMELLLWLLAGVTLGMLIRVAGPRALKWLLSASGRRDTNDDSTGPAWHSVSVVPGHGACATSRRLASRRWLTGDAPRLPLAGCDGRQCDCRYRRHADRRDEEDRRNPLDTMGQFGGFETASRKERRHSDDRRTAGQRP